MTITKRLLELDGQLQLHDEGEWSKTHSEYQAFNDAGVECEVGEFLYGAVRVLKPNNVLETGTHHGIGASYMGLALADNKKGHLDTIEFAPQFNEIAQKRMERLGLSDRVTCHLGDVKNFLVNCQYEFIFLDTEPILRFHELVKFYDHLVPGGMAFIHDTPRDLCQGNVNPDHPQLKSWPFGDVPDQLVQWVTEGKLKVFHFPTPRGLTGFYKAHENDYKWTV